jgi:signal transduction histidine kinase
MRRRLLAGFLAFALAVIVLLELPLGISLANNARTTALSEIENDGASLALLVGASLQRHDWSDARAIIDRFTRDDHAVVAVVANSHLELSSGAGVREELADASTRAILRAAASGKVQGEEGSGDPDDDLLYVAIPVAIQEAGGVATSAKVSSTATDANVVLLVTEPAAALHAKLNRDRLELALFGAAMLAAAAGIGTLLAVSLTRPLAKIETALGRFGAGQLGTRVGPTRGPAELRVLRTTVNEMADRITELLDTQRAFVADASHQLRAPMTALRLRLENLAGALEPGHEDDSLQVIAEIDRLSRVVDGLLELARSDGKRPGRVALDVGEVLKERADAWSALADERHVALRCDFAGSGRQASLTALACPGHLDQVLDNLLANALDATPAGGEVSLTAESHSGHVVVHVVDSGSGMSASDRARAFDRFWRSEGAPRDGTGLGLAIVAQLVRVSGGTTWLDAAPGGGTDAVVRLEAR